MARLLPLAIVLLIAVWFRVPSIGEGMPYFYNEDEAHHFNRTVNMVKEGEWNPRYFHKPSLHFYVRMPVVAASFIWSVKKGYLRSLKEIRTQDPSGIGGYAFTASHPGIVKWNRALTVLLSVCIVLTTFLLAELLTGNRVGALGASLVVAISPELVRHGAVVGVDILMSFMALGSVYIGVRCVREFSLSTLALSSLVAGLAVSSKYNAAPIVLVPWLVVAVTRSWSWRSVGIAAVVPAFGFLIGSPFVLAEIPRFLDQLAYEVWHYKIAGHEGHTGEPGLPQALFYLSWLGKDAVGWLVLGAGMIGIVWSLIRRRAEWFVALSFPILFFFLMTEQRVNFTRNMIVVIPFLAIAAVQGALLLGREKRWVVTALAAALMIQPFALALSVRSAQASIPESRRLLEDELLKLPDDRRDTALSGRLQLPLETFSQRGRGGFNQETESPLSLWMAGYGRVVSNSQGVQGVGASLLEPLVTLAGEPSPQRVVHNPEIRIQKLREEGPSREEILAFLAGDPQATVQLSRGGDRYRCTTPARGEDYCWLTSRYARVQVEDVQRDPNFSGRNGIIRVLAMVMTPWTDQEARLSFEDLLAWVPIPLARDRQGAFHEVALELPYQEFKDSGAFLVNLSDIHSPVSQGIGEDRRRLGLAIREIRIPQQ